MTMLLRLCVASLILMLLMIEVGGGGVFSIDKQLGEVLLCGLVVYIEGINLVIV